MKPLTRQSSRRAAAWPMGLPALLTNEACRMARLALTALLVSHLTSCSSGAIGDTPGRATPRDPRGTGTGPGSETGAGGASGTGAGTPPGGTAGSGPGAGTGGSTGVPPGGPSACTPAVPPTSQLPRLTRAEYDNTTRDLLGIDVKPSAMLAPDTVGSVDQRAWAGFQAAADSLATQVMANPTARAKAIPCAPSGDGVACAQQFIQQFGQRAFRRPLTPAEVARFQILYTTRAQITATGTFDEAAQAILKAFLQSPSFLTRAEVSEAAPDGTNFALNGHEMASRLSYMIWGTMPDDALFTAAAANKLSATADILAQAQRMLKDPKARTRVGAFHERYALMGEATRWSEASHDPVAFPAFKAGMAPLLAEEAKRFFDYITFDQGGTFQDLLTKPVAFVNKDLAPIYGLNAANFGPDLQLTNLDPTQRSGVFTHAGFLASYSSYERSSPILRGAFIEKQVLCREIPPPPADAFNSPLPTTGTTNREQVTAQTSAAACASCHSTIVNPPGFALEAYDSIGSFQTKERTTGAPIDSVADVAIGSKTVRVNGPVDLMTQIAASPEGQSCYAQRLMSYAYERELKSEDTCSVQTLAGRMAQSGYTLLNLMTDLTQTQAFRVRAKVQP
jgi:hypothetical protein